jgi:Glycosyltransferase family 87
MSSSAADAAPELALTRTIRGPALVTAAARISNVLLFGIVPAVVFLGVLWFTRDFLAVDLHHAFRPAAEAVLAGESPYPPATVEVMAKRDAYVYLPLAAIALTPFALLPPLVADLLAMALVLAIGAAALWILGVRDWRCYGLTLAMPPAFHAVQTANLTLPLLLGLAAVWALRSRTVAPGVVLALTLASKLFLWPILVWWLATRRFRTALVAIGATAALVVGSWSVISFAGMREYPELLRVLTDTLGTDSYTVFALASDLGLAELPARLLGLIVASGVLAGSVVLGRRGDDARSFALAVLASLLFSPIVWLHYFALLLVPIAIVHRRLSYLWVLPLVLWACAAGVGNGTTVQTALTLASMGALAWLAVRSCPRRDLTPSVAA